MNQTGRVFSRIGRDMPCLSECSVFLLPFYTYTILLEIQLPVGKSIYFASDFHLGVPDRAASRQREAKICEWLSSIKEKAHALFLVGDIFDAWFEYRHVVPKGYIRFLGKLAELKDAGISIYLFTGNHDLWMRDYFEEELGVPVFHGPIELQVNEKSFFVAHGDGLGPGDHGYKFLKSVMAHPVAQWLYRRLHPDLGLGLANYFSRKGPKHGSGEKPFQGEDKEWLVLFSKEMLEQKHFDYFVFGHRHLALSLPVGKNSIYINLGDWIRYYSYARFDGNDLELEFFCP